MLTQERAIEIYQESLDELNENAIPEKQIKIDPEKIIEFIKDNWWWISVVGEKIFRWVIKKLNQWKQKKNKK